MTETDSSLLVSRFLEGDRRALSRLMSRAERDPRGVGETMLQLRGRLGRAHVIGVTGPPGAGKSTLLLRLAREYRSQGRTLGIVAVDPTSPISGGSVLGDRIRMLELHSDPGVFIRSMASGGLGGGLAATTMDLVDLLDAYGFEAVFVESVGVGQGETDIARLVDTNVVVVVPGLGDDIQALKAGVLETGDVFVVNKFDRVEAKATLVTLRAMLELGEAGPWKPPIVGVSALTGEGIIELRECLDRHRQYLQSSPLQDERQAQRLRERARRAALTRLTAALDLELAASDPAPPLDDLLRRVAARISSPTFD